MGEVQREVGGEDGLLDDPQDLAVLTTLQVLQDSAHNNQVRIW